MAITRSLLLFAGMLLLAVGLVLHPFEALALKPRWIDLLQCIVALALVSELLTRLLRLPRAATVLMAGIGLLAVGHGGLGGLLASVLVLLSGLAAGTLLARSETTDPWLLAIAGLGLVAAVLGWLLPFPLHFQVPWLLALSVLCWRQRQPLAAALSSLATSLRGEYERSPRMAWVAAVLLVLASLPAWPPIRMSDDLSYHLVTGWSLLEFGHARLDVGNQVWSLAPWATDALHGLVMVLARAEVTGPLNVFWLFAATWLSRCVGLQLGLAPRMAWLSALLYASLPISIALTGSMQAEAATPAMFAALVLLVLRSQAPDPATLRLLAVIAGLMMATKASNALLLLPFLAWLPLRYRGLPPLRMLWWPALLGLFAGGSSYAYAWALTGNPLLPLFNGVFQSPWFAPDNFVDGQWKGSLGLDLPWRLVFFTGEYYEARAGAAGLALLVLVGGVLTGLADRRLRPVIAVCLFALLMVFWQMAYLRYVHPLMPVLVPALVAALSTATVSRWREGLVAALVVAQLALSPTANWMMFAGAEQIYLRKGSEAMLSRFAPERLLAQRFREIAQDGDILLFVSPTHSALGELPGRATQSSWHSPRLGLLRPRDAGDGDAWSGFMLAAGASHAVVRGSDQMPGLDAYLLEHGELLAYEGNARLYRLRHAPRPMAVVGEPGAVRASIELPATGRVLGSARIEMTCGQPGAAIAVAWHLSKPRGGETSQWLWTRCSSDGKAVSEAKLAAAGGGLRFEARPAIAGESFALEVSSANATLRQDPLAGNELYRRTWRLACGEDRCGAQAVWLEVRP